MHEEDFFDNIEHQKLVVYQLGIFISTYGIHLTIRNWFLSLLVVIIFSFLTTWCFEILASGFIGILLGYIVTLKFRNIKDKWWDEFIRSKEEYIIHLVLVPFVVSYFSVLFVPETSYPVGIILMFIIWFTIWNSSYDFLFPKSPHVYYTSWLLPILIASLFSYFFYNILWVSIGSSTLITLLILIIPFNVK